jgi:hypothetical protein
MRAVTLFASLLLLVTVTGCSRLTKACTAELGVRVSPRDTTVAVGSALRPVVQLTSCGGAQYVTDHIAYSSSDPAVVRVDSASGTLTALRVGSATISVSGATYGSLGVMRIAITAAP